jgi:hypothetical protein
MDIPITGIKLCGVKEPEKLKGNVVTLLYAKSVRPGGNDSLQFPGYQAWYQGEQIGWVPKYSTSQIKQFLNSEVRVLVKITKITKNAIGSYDVTAEKLTQWPAHEFYSVPESKIDFGELSAKQKERISESKTEQQKVKTPTLSEIISSNMTAATNAAKLEVGHVANDQLAKIVGKRTPKKYAALLDTPLGHLMLANAVTVAGQAFYPGNQNLRMLTHAMTVDAYQQLVKTLDIPGIIDELLSNKAVVGALKESQNE